MAVKTFEELVAGLQLSADEKKVFDNALAKEPELKKGWLRQDEFSREMNEISSKKKRLTELEEYQARMKPWSDTTYAKLAELKEKGVFDVDTGEELWTAQKADLERQIAAAAVAGGDMDPKELEKRVKEIVTASGGVTKDELNALVQSEARKLAKEEFGNEWKARETDFNTKTIPMVAGFSAATAVMAAKYEKEAGEPWTAEKQKELFDLMGKENNFDPFVVGEKMLAPVRDKKAREAEINAEADKRYKQRIAEMGMPGGGGEDYIPQGDGGARPMGALQAALKASGDANGDIDQLIRSKAVEAATALKGEGKF
jgi:hypothetical protein